jgi:hypothetical protein
MWHQENPEIRRIAVWEIEPRAVAQIVVHSAHPIEQ